MEWMISQSAEDNIVGDCYNPDEDQDIPRRPKKRSARQPILARRRENGAIEPIGPKDSVWYSLYVEFPNIESKRFQAKFRRQFRMPHNSFCDLVQDAREGEWFPRWMGNSASGTPSSPLELLVLGALRYLGRGWTFDDLEESTAISEEVHRVFFHEFIAVGSTLLFNKYVKVPSNEEELKDHMLEFEMAGLPGACGSCDATHIVHEMCAFRLQRIHKGFKTKYPTRAFNITANHRRQIIATTSGHPGSWNDKTLVMYDDFVKDIKSGRLFCDNRFELLERRNGSVVSVHYQGVWLVVDNGYHNWSITVPPFSNSNNRQEIRWSEWVESMRKDVEVSLLLIKL